MNIDYFYYLGLFSINFFILVNIYLFLLNNEKFNNYIIYLISNIKSIIIGLFVICSLRFLYFYYSYTDFTINKFLYVIFFSLSYSLFINLIFYLLKFQIVILREKILNSKIYIILHKYYDIVCNYYGNKFVQNIYLFVVKYEYFEEYYNFCIFYDKILMKINNLIEKYENYYILLLFYIFLILNKLFINSLIGCLILLILIIYFGLKFPFTLYYKLIVINNNIEDYIEKNRNKIIEDLIIKMGIVDEIVTKGGQRLTQLAVGVPKRLEYLNSQGELFGKKYGILLAGLGGTVAFGVYAHSAYIERETLASQERMEQHDLQYKKNMEQIEKDKVASNNVYKERKLSILEKMAEESKKEREEEIRKKIWLEIAKGKDKEK